ncbi:NAD(P)H-hydrate dehydratase [Moorella sulfitireducens (nom. illeg.)]|uniref:NAD(P)H-hydrate dehydratase n=1 Tax=Neomoorella sulfitireducens TaxID=2972948 RepID=UPI0021AD3A04|nr:NAD(P)H-hydrate dehydratase [Moorella sulfitireducens]
MLIAGTVPVTDMPMVYGRVEREGGNLRVDGHSLPCTQGTMALVSAALATTSHLELEPPRVLLAGDIGTGKGSRLIYQYLIEHIGELAPDVLALHYCQPIVTLMQRFYTAVEKCRLRPVLIADAGSMYAAKAAGLAPHFDLFTPDPSEIAFLADPDAVHPAYIKRHLFEDACARVPELIKSAYDYGGAAKCLLVKGAVDYIVRDGIILETINEPNIPEMECIGGTGDTITGMAAAFAYAGLEPDQAAGISAKANRAAGQRARPTPATGVAAIIDQLPAVFKENLCAWSGVCTK